MKRTALIFVASLLCLSVAALSGGLGGLIAHAVAVNLRKTGLIKKWSNHEEA